MAKLIVTPEEEALRQRRDAQTAAINAMVTETGQQVYTNVVGMLYFDEDLVNATPKEIQEHCRAAARFAKLAAPFYAEAYNYVSVPDVKEPSDVGV